jgi:hypothetical protein
MTSTSTSLTVDDVGASRAIGRLEAPASIVVVDSDP